MKAERGEYLPSPGEADGADPAATRAQTAARRRELLRGFRARAWEALRLHRISRGAFTYLNYLIEWAKSDGDGDSLTLGERAIRERTGWGVNTLRRYRRQLERWHLVKFERRWAFKRGWFYEAKTSLFLLPPSASVLEAESASKIGAESASKMDASLNRVSSEVGLRLCPAEPGEALHGSSLRSGEDGEGDARSLRSTERLAAGHPKHPPDHPTPHGKAKSRPQGASRQVGEASNEGSTPTPPGKNGPGRTDDAPWGRRQKDIMRRLRQALGTGFDNDAGKWAGRAKTSPGKCERVLGEVEFTIRSGKPIKKSVPAYAEDTWKRFR